MRLMNDKKKVEDKEGEPEEDEQLKLDSLRKAGNIAKKVKKYIKPKIKIGIKALEIVTNIEKKIKELGGSCAFPANVCVNNIAAHYTSPIKDDGLTINENDLVKVDLGVHIEGYIVDTAFSVNFNEDKALENIIQSTEVAVEAAKMMVKPEINTRKLGAKIESIIKGFKYNPIKELGGHQIERWTVHGKKALPELGTQHGDKMEIDDVFAIEVFASTGIGSVHNLKYSYIHELNPYSGRVPLRRKSSKQILGYVNKHFKTLPFSERWLAEEFRVGVLFGLQELSRKGKLKTHHVLSENKGEYVSQSEETVLVTEDGFEQLT
ncbi:MAG: type II methionyl aminopeptidase [Candidatus Lokiarchaeota archaeon]|nr:type II methionyl aminopeptidase [Candidatus Lokiarchaeota archaeon]MBD3339277.1 type II methionyl aminopeptidase [Candidatus Lokiarchaeota archaeon]